MKRIQILALTAAIALSSTAFSATAHAASPETICENETIKSYIYSKECSDTTQDFQKILDELCKNWGIKKDDCSDDQPETGETNPGYTPETPETKPETPTPDTEKEPETPETDTSTPETPEQGEDEGSEKTFERQVADLVNQERKKAGLSEIVFDESASAAALVRAKEIEASFAHTRPDGRSFDTALTDAGISFRSAGENIAWGQKTPQEVVEAWMNSSGHRANILGKNFTRLGVGYYQNPLGRAYWVQLFLG